ncbi:MAG: alanine racemase [Candidatus Falkowbacteria bacterium]|nr:alanine racemase [Candidatus Falkowbacteria bacterium]
MELLRLLRKIKKYFVRYNPSVEVIVSQTRLVENLKEYQQQYPKLSFAPVLKSNAYGHGLVQVAEILDQENIAFFVLDSLHEAIILRHNGIKSEILIIGYTQSENIKNSKLSKIAFTITSLEQLAEVASTLSSKTKIHLKIDTGMHRQGIQTNQIKSSIEIIKTNKSLVLEGICSHFADADNPDDETFTKSQIEEWERVVELFKKNFPIIKFFHISATAGTYYSDQTNENVARLGIGLYGINPSPFTKLNLKPVLQMQSIVSSLKKLPAGEHIGYNITYKTKGAATIATIPVGYFEGVDRRLSNCGFSKIGSNYCPIVGRVSMNITSIDVTSVPNIKLDDKVIIISRNRDDKNSVESIAKITHTIPYEILVHIPQHLRRIVVGN